jgi:D-amino-acid dehydrogenase
VELLQDTPITELRVDGGQVSGAVTGTGAPVPADHVVLAAGVSTGALARQVGLRLPLRGAKGYSVTFKGCAPELKVPLYLSEAKVAISPYCEGVRVLGTMELGTDPNSLRHTRVQAMLTACTNYLPGLSLTSPSRPWAGLRAMVPDGLPVIGSASAARNVVVATGHAMLGVTLAPATGELVADLVEGREPPEYARAFSPGRF